MQRRPDRREAVAALRAHVGALVVRAQVVEAEVVRRGDPADVAPRVRERDAPSGGADDEGDLALEGEQLGAGRALDRAAGCRDRARRLEEVRGGGGAAAALVGARRVAEVDRDDLAGSRRAARRTGRSAASVVEFGHELPRSCVVSEIVYHLSIPRQARFCTALAGQRSRHDIGVTHESASVADGFTPTGTIATTTDRRRVVFATVVGTTVEWYDFFIYATAVGLVFGQLFFAPLGARSSPDPRVPHGGRQLPLPPARRVPRRPLRRQVRPQGRADADADPDGRRHRR